MYEPVLMVISCQNYLGFSGFNLSNTDLSIYPEKEILLTQGCPAYVVGVEDFVIQGKHDGFP